MKRLVPALLLAALCVSCSPPLFDFSLSQSIVATRNMTRDNPSEVTISAGFDSNAGGFVFYPRVAQSGGDFLFDYTSGFVVSSSGFAVDVRGASGGAGEYHLYGGASEPLVSPDAHAPAYAAWPVKSPSPSSAHLFGLVFNAADPKQNGFSMFTGTPSSGSVMGNGDLMANKVGIANAAVVGASFGLDPSMYDMSSWLVATAGMYQEVLVTLIPPSLGGVSQIRAGPYPLAFLPSGVSRFQYFYDVNALADPARLPNRSFASWFDAVSGGWKCAAWWGTTGTGDWAMLPIDHRIDALLTTGELLSMEDGTGRLYSRDGILLSTFPLGTLAFIGEEYVGGAARAYFCRSLRYDDTLRFNVYWIQTDKLKGIGG